jgi:ligand-binding sensor domain-containing protein
VGALLVASDLSRTKLREIEGSRAKPKDTEPHPPTACLAPSLALAAAIIVCLSGPAWAERITSWKNHTNVREVTALAASGDTLWVATRGGLVRVVTGDTLTEQCFTNADGLGGNDLRFVTLDSQQTLWTGGTNGRLSHRRGDSRWDVYRFENDNGLPIALNAATPGPDGFLWVASDVGVHKFDTRRHGGEIKETYSRIGAWPDGATARDLLVQDGYIWVAGDAGVARARVDDPFLLDRSHWQTWTDIRNLLAIGVNDHRVYAGGKDGLYVRAPASAGSGSADTQWVPTIFKPGAVSVRDLYADQDTLWIVSSAGLVWHRIPRFDTAEIHGAMLSGLASVVRTSEGTLWVGQQGMGVWQRDDEWTQREFNGPLDNSFADVAVGADGKIWCVHANYGADFLATDHWTKLPYFDAGPTYPGTSVAVAPDGDVWLGAWGAGAYRVNPMTPLADTGWTHYDTANSTLMWHQNAGRTPNNYIVVRDVAVDPYGRVWFANASADSGRVLAFYDHGCWGVFDSSDGLTSRSPAVLWAQADTILIGMSDAGLTELTYGEPLCAGGEPVSQRGHVRAWDTGDHLPANEVRAVLVDRADSVWVGTNVGLSRYTADRRRFFDVSLPAEAGLTINALAADAANSIWVGTSLGLVVIAPEGTMEYYNSTNSGLVGDAVSEIAVDERTGMMWIATESGLSQTMGALPPAQAVANVVAYPNPFEVSSTGEDRVRFNTRFGSRVFIFTVAGQPVVDLDASLGWNGRDSDGQPVASGIYLFVVHSPDGGYGRGKIAVRRWP